jgi:hypothetical protein
MEAGLKIGAIRREHTCHTLLEALSKRKRMHPILAVRLDYAVYGHRHMAMATTLRVPIGLRLIVSRES